MNNANTFANENNGKSTLKRVKSSARKNIPSDSIGTIYVYKNDPKVINKGVNISNFRGAQEGFLPLLSDNSYQERKLDNVSYCYDDRLNHGSRPMHQNSFAIGSSAVKNDYLTKNRIVILFL